MPQGWQGGSCPLSSSKKEKKEKQKQERKKKWEEIKKNEGKITKSKILTKMGQN